MNGPLVFTFGFQYQCFVFLLWTLLKKIRFGAKAFDIFFVLSLGKMGCVDSSVLECLPFKPCQNVRQYCFRDQRRFKANKKSRMKIQRFKSFWYSFVLPFDKIYGDIVAEIKDSSNTSKPGVRSCYHLRFGDGNRGKKSESIFPRKFINIKEGSATLEQWRRRNGNINVKWKHQRRTGNFEEGAATSEEEWKNQRRRSSARLLLFMDHHSHQDHSPQQAVLSGIVAQGDVQGESLGKKLISFLIPLKGTVFSKRQNIMWCH